MGGMIMIGLDKSEAKGPKQKWWALLSRVVKLSSGVRVFKGWFRNGMGTSIWPLVGWLVVGSNVHLSGADLLVIHVDGWALPRLLDPVTLSSRYPFPSSVDFISFSFSVYIIFLSPPPLAGVRVWETQKLIEPKQSRCRICWLAEIKLNGSTRMKVVGSRHGVPRY